MVSFFFIVGKFDEIELKEFLLKRYSNIQYILDMELDDLSAFIKLAKEKDDEEKLREEWTTLLPHMVMGILKYVTLDEYIDRRTGRNIDMRPAEEIIAEINELHEKKGGKNGLI